MIVSKKSFLIAGLATGLLAAAAMPAAATTISYTLDNGGSAFTTPGNYGTVMLDDSSGTYTLVTVTLATGYNFVTTGNSNSHVLFGYNAAGAVTNITDPSSPPQTFGSVTGWNGSPFGTFGYGIVCTNCANGGPGASGSPLTFRVTGATVSSFAVLSTGGSPNAYFTADIIDDSGNTGQVGATGTPTVPEPGTLALLGLGLMGLGAARRRRA